MDVIVCNSAFHIPVMTEVYLPGLDYSTRLNIVDLAYQQFETSSRKRSVWTYAWRYYILEKGNKEPLSSFSSKAQLSQRDLTK